jgi:hypothetical protein
MVDVQAKGLTGRLVERDQLDRRIEVAQPLLDLPLEVVQAGSVRRQSALLDRFRAEKKGGPGPTS